MYLVRFFLAAMVAVFSSDICITPRVMHGMARCGLSGLKIAVSAVTFYFHPYFGRVLNICENFMRTFNIWKTRLNRMGDVLLGTERHMRTRTSQAALASALILASMADLFLLACYGLANIQYVAILSIFCTLELVLAFGLIRSGFSRRWPDPSLAFEQMLFAVACNAVGYVLAGHGRGVSLALLAVILMFGMFGMSMRQVTVVALSAMLWFGAAMLVSMEQALTDDPPVLYAASFFMVLIVLTSCTVLTHRLGLMRAYIRNQKTQLAQALEKIQLIATRDELTGTANRRHMLQLMGEEIQRADRNGTALMVAILDIDHFKRVNDNYGHQAGDVCLQAFASVVQSSIRSTDRLARWGGEEFLILLTETDIALAMDGLERVRTQVAQAVVAVGNIKISMTVSIGVTQYQVGDSIEQTIDRADLALYSAKEQGRDQTIIC